jgi:hypothetical protein
MGASNMVGTPLTAERLTEWVSSSLTRTQSASARDLAFRGGGQERLREVATRFAHLLDSAASRQSRQLSDYLAEMAFQLNSVLTEDGPEIASDVALRVLREFGLTSRLSHQTAFEEVAHAIRTSDKGRLVFLLDYYRPRRWWQRLFFWATFLTQGSPSGKLPPQAERRMLDRATPAKSSDCGPRPEPVSHDSGSDADHLPQLPKLDPKIVQFVPAAVAKLLRVVPVTGDANRVVLVRTHVLTEEERNVLTLMCPGRHFDVITDPNQHSDVRRHLTELIAEYYPAEEGAIDCRSLTESVPQEELAT